MYTLCVFRSDFRSSLAVQVTACGKYGTAMIMSTIAYEMSNTGEKGNNGQKGNNGDKGNIGGQAGN